MRQSCTQGNCWVGSMMSNFTFQSNFEHSLIVQSLLAAGSTPHSWISLCNLLHSVETASILPFPVLWGRDSFCFFFLLSLHGVLVLFFWNTGRGTPEHYYGKRTASFEQADKELCFSPFGSVRFTSQNVCPVARTRLWLFHEFRASCVALGWAKIINQTLK